MEERAVAGYDDEICVAYPVGGGEVNGVVATQAVGFGEGSGSECQLLINLNEIELAPSIVELVDSLPKLTMSESSEPLCLGEGSTGLRIQEANTDNAISSVPERRGAG